MIEMFPTVTEFFVIPVVEFNCADVAVVGAAQVEALVAAPASEPEAMTTPVAAIAVAVIRATTRWPTRAVV